ncbi:DUF6166 domain-containing protein [Haloplanus salinarum]|uniref:DUF6166 domain-containing protein n=1 Tax=Haloplanus salinarum TaxID=1912324 RepID=UPI00214AC5CD|nr:DUF6166 domain-containing protein [Haloplanus salinarum]
MSRQPQGSTGGNARLRPSNEGEQSRATTEHVYHGRRDPTAPVGQECTVTVDGEPLDLRYDLLSASPAGFEWSYGGSGPAQLAIALLAHAFEDEFAERHYQRFKREVVSELPEERWILRKRNLDAWRREVVSDA